MNNNEFSWKVILHRLFWDLMDTKERIYYEYHLLSEVPGSFGNLLRARYCSKRFKRAGSGLRVLSGARFRSIENLEVGCNVSIGNDCFIQALGGVIIGNDVMLGPGVKVWSVNHKYKNRDCLISSQGLEKKTVVLGNDIWVGANSFITPGVQLADGVVVAAGSVVTAKPHMPYSVIAGNPARMISFRKKMDPTFVL